MREDDGAVVGRAGELDRCRRVLASAGDGRSSVLVVRGDAGIGKTALVDAVAGQARRDGFTVARTTGLAFERQLQFAGLHALTLPLLGADASASPAGELLRAAFGSEDGRVDDLPLLRAVLFLVTVAAESSPVLMVVDDAHWLDDASLRAVLFVAHRLDADRVALLITSRSDVRSLLDDTSFDEIVLPGLDPDAAVELLAGADVVPSVARRCQILTGGNPLALLESAGALSPSQRAGREELPLVLHLGDRLLERFSPLIDELPAPTRRALEVLALDSDSTLPVVTGALRALGRGPDALEPAIDRGLVRVEGQRIAWANALLAAVVRHTTPAERRREAHRALADSMARTAPDRATWHLAESALGADEALARPLERRGHRLYARGNLHMAAFAFERAARLSPAGADSLRRMLLAATARWGEGSPSAIFADLEELADRVADESQRADVDVLLGQVELWHRGSHTAVRRFEAGAARVVGTDPGLAARLLLHRAAAHLVGLDSPAAVASTVEAAALAAGSGDVGALLGSAALGVITAVLDGQPPTGEGLDLATVVARATDAMDGEINEGSVATEAVQLGAFALIAADEPFEALAAVDRVINLSERGGVIGRARLARLIRAEALWRTGQWAQSLAEASLAESMGHATGTADSGTFALACLARVEAGLGWSQDCRRHANEAISHNLERGLAFGEAWARSALGLLALSEGDYPEAADHLDAVAALSARMRAPGWLWWAGDAVEALHLSGRWLEARERHDALARSAERSGSPWARAVAARAGAVIGLADAETALDAAIAGFRRISAPFEEARALLLRGERRAEAGHPGAADDLREAAAVFDRLGARCWSERVTSIRPQVRGAAANLLTTRLSPAELRVALAVGAGATNRQAADQLYLSVKTVDFHLQSIFRKLGIRRRAQLASVVAAQAGPAAVSPS